MLTWLSSRKRIPCKNEYHIVSANLTVSSIKYMIEFTTPIPDYPCEIDKTVTQEQLQKVLSDHVEKQQKRLADELGTEYLQGLKDKYKK